MTTRKNNRPVQRQGQIYRFSINGKEYAAFIWQFGKKFQGRVEGMPHVPLCTGLSAAAVRDSLQDWIAKDAAY
ncbi:hypothetical protein SE17_26325 [Kouleothrix aurantiaca]|jgi:hypothetical protein|uniref:Uncharacterized protein n=1 Tax=Kouleothrix aurantiaca TaxID=186479 RepID=A0A0P9DKY6_9CHLR|nr:hypothetical protein SE17_26325 [Kouleothrix aurantiaca]